ncbi:MAG: hypothetical protein AAF600_20535, partial [Bacteroidota bacterium]
MISAFYLAFAFYLYFQENLPWRFGNFLESFAKLDFWLKSRLSEFQKRSLLVVNEAFEILSNEELGQKAGFSK